MLTQRQMLQNFMVLAVKCIVSGKSTPVLCAVLAHLISEVCCSENLSCVTSFDGLLQFSGITYASFFKGNHIVAKTNLK